MPDALLLAGGGLERERFEGLDPAIERKAQIPVLGRPMVEWTAAAARASPSVERIVVVGDPGLATPGMKDLAAGVVPEGAGIVENLRAGLDALPGSERVVVLSGDLPLLTGEALEDLFANAPRADVVFPYLERHNALRDFPDREWMFARTPDGAFTGCSAFLCRPAALLANWEWVDRLLNARRRSVLGLAMLIGPVFALKYLLRRLRVADVERKVSTLLRLEGRGYRTRFSELAMDVDKFADIAFVEDVLRRRSE